MAHTNFSSIIQLTTPTNSYGYACYSAYQQRESALHVFALIRHRNVMWKAKWFLHGPFKDASLLPTNLQCSFLSQDFICHFRSVWALLFKVCRTVSLILYLFGSQTHLFFYNKSADLFEGSEMRYSKIRFTKMRSKPSVLEVSILGNFLTLATDSIKDVTLLFPTLKIHVW